jgi:catechol 2,3-dioxygenase-like lactoylglutathione lyase family enzyme
VHMAELDLTIDHITLSVADLGRAKGFYSAALGPLGIALIAEVSAEASGDVAFAGYGLGRKGTLWLAARGKQTPPTHVCFRAKTRAAVRNFYEAALTAGGVDNGPPGPRTEYHDAYYAAFVLDPDGNNIEALCLEPE